MKNIDYIIVGCGLAGIAFCEQLRAHRKTFIVIDDNLHQSSTVAAGLYNPVILKRFTKVWNAQLQLDLALPYYESLEQLLNIKLDHKLPVYRKFTSIKEQNEWFNASDKPVLRDFLSTTIIKNTNSNIKAPLGFGEVLHSGRINTSQLVNSYRNYLKEVDCLKSEEFQYKKLNTTSEIVTYQNINSRHIIFAEGFGITSNPYFKHLPLNGTKGEMLTIKAPKLKMNFVLKSSVFIVPLGEDLYWIGATYEREDKTYQISKDARTDLISKVKTIISCDFEIVNQVAGIRPTTKDRRPLVGVHHEYANMYVLNGLGTRGVMISPYIAKQLFKHIEIGETLDPEIDIKRIRN